MADEPFQCAKWESESILSARLLGSRCYGCFTLGSVMQSDHDEDLGRTGCMERWKLGTRYSVLSRGLS